LSAVCFLIRYNQVFRPGFQADAGFGAGSKKYDKDYDAAACGLGRLVVVCRYLAHNATRKAMDVSVGRIDAALKTFDGSPPGDKPRDMENVTYRAAHQKWFQDMWKEGIVGLKKEIGAGADWLKARNDDFTNKLPKATKDMVDAIIKDREDALKDHCPPEEFAWPSG